MRRRSQRPRATYKKRKVSRAVTGFKRGWPNYGALAEQDKYFTKACLKGGYARVWAMKTVSSQVQVGCVLPSSSPLSLLSHSPHNYKHTDQPPTSGTPKGPAPETLSFPNCLLSISSWMNGPHCLMQMPPRVLHPVFHCPGSSPGSLRKILRAQGHCLTSQTTPMLMKKYFQAYQYLCI